MYRVWVSLVDVCRFNQRIIVTARAVMSWELTCSLLSQAFWISCRVSTYYPIYRRWSRPSGKSSCSNNFTILTLLVRDYSKPQKITNLQKLLGRWWLLEINEISVSFWKHYLTVILSSCEGHANLGNLFFLCTRYSICINWTLRVEYVNVELGFDNTNCCCVD